MKILLVEDNLRLITILKNQFKYCKWIVKGVSTYQEAVNVVFAESFDLIICDYDLGKKEKKGLDLIKEIRERKIQTPIIVLTGRPDIEISSWNCLNIGADDFVKKPYNIKELIARINAIARRKFKCENNSTNILCDDGIKLDINLRELWIEGKKVNSIGNIPFLILKRFLKHKGERILYHELLEYIWGEDSLYQEKNMGILRVHMTYLKKILGENVSKKIKIIRGVGYIWQ